VHELGVVIEIVKTVEEFAAANGLTRIDTVVLQIGELSSMVPRYIEECYPAAVDGTSLQDTKLRIEIIPGNALCKACGKVFNLLKEEGACPGCGSRSFELLSGKEFLIKEVIAC